MGIVEKQRKQIANLEAKNRMLKRMYETKKVEAVKAMTAEAAAEYILICALEKLGGTMEVSKKDIENARKREAAGKILPDGTIQYILLNQGERPDGTEGTE